MEAGNIAQIIDEGGYGAPLDEEGRKERKSKHEIEEAQESSRKKQEAAVSYTHLDPFFYQGKTRIGNHATKVYIGKSGSIQALMYTCLLYTSRCV